MNEEILNLLKTVIYPGFTKNIVDYGFVKEASEDKVVVEISSSAPEVKAILTDEITKALKEYSNIEILIEQPKMPRETSSKGKNLAPQIKNFVMVSSGKGGVGKSTTTVNLAISLAKQGKKVGILDADIYGPNVPRMMGVEDQEPEVLGNKVKPIVSCGVEVMSMGILMEAGQSLIWRGAMIMKVINQLLQDILWSDLDVLFIDMPPGTGDAQLSLAQSVPVTAGVVVTTPQKVALDDTLRSLDMFQKLHIPIAGVVENMSGFICPDTGKEYDLFGKGTTPEVAESYKTTVMAEVPIEPAVRIGGDTGKPVSFFEPSTETSMRYEKAATALWAFMEKVNEEGGADNEAIQPTTPPGVSACSTAAAAPTQGSGHGDGSCGSGCGCH
jgi:ATP-binding protein involved in chromosome partitioning